MESSETNLEPIESISIDEEIKDCLLETAKWANFLSILGFIGIGLLILGSFFLLLFESSMRSDTYYNGNRLNTVALFFGYFIAAGIYFFPIYYLFQFSNNTIRAIHSNDQESFVTGIRNLKSHYKFIGIAAIIVVSLYILLFLFLFSRAAFR